MTDETTHPPLEEILEKIFGPAGHATPEQAYWPSPSVTQAAHDYTRRNIGPSVGTVADRIETAFLAGAQWALTNNPADEPTREARKEAWDEGYEAAEINEHEHRPGRKLTNPYTAQRHQTRKEQK
ncbi:hypothetical protein [Dermabacter hominis]|uniref:hypothetical protein n=1 Tax=Dermabacter hominis TaxID=36740 RepID=UPI002A482173|nr:hypothetical protein [Dermabacter hominis]